MKKKKNVEVSENFNFGNLKKNCYIFYIIFNKIQKKRLWKWTSFSIELKKGYSPFQTPPRRCLVVAAQAPVCPEILGKESKLKLGGGGGIKEQWTITPLHLGKPFSGSWKTKLLIFFLISLFFSSSLYWTKWIELVKELKRLEYYYIITYR